MKAGFYLGNHTYEVKEIKDRKPVDHEVKIEVAWCGLCGTDIHKFEGKNGASVVVPPIILGHECSGIVTEVGENCENFKPGDRVACDPSWGCGRCEWCKKGYQNFCIHRHGVAKGFAEYVYPPEENVYKIDHSLDLEDAAFTEPLSCVLHGMDLLNIESGSNIVMYGMGSIGSLMLQLLKLTAPKNLIVVEREENKQELAIELGATKACTDQEIEEIADKLREKQYNNFDEFRNDFWKAVAETDYANEFLINGDPKNYYRMKNGGAPLVVSNQAINGSFTYQLHHIIPINQGGSVYSVDNLVVVTPRYHAEILIPEVHGYNGFKQFFR